jgi:hypothetical protein
MNLKI